MKECKSIKVLVGTGLLWEESLFWVQVYFGEKDLCWEQAHFWREISIFGAHTTGGRKATCKKRRKNNMKEENKHGIHGDMPNYARVRVFDKDYKGYNPKK
jgi:hypothetical protein